jgi:hypothetical protein
MRITKLHLGTLVLFMPLGMACICGCGKGDLTGGSQPRTGELGHQFIRDLIAVETPAGREQLVKRGHEKSISLNGTVSELWPGVGGDWFFHLDTPETSAQTTKKLVIQVNLDMRQFARTSFAEGKGVGEGLARCQYSNGSTLTIKNGDDVALTGILWDYSDEYLT